MQKLIDSPYTTWLVLFLPAPPLLWDLVEYNRYYAEIMYESGILATQFLVLALAITPLMRLSRRWPTGLSVLRWLQRRRRYIGVAAAGYGALHAIFYIRYTGSLELVWLELEEISLLTGWVVMLLFVALVATSNDASVRRLGKWWKRLQMTAYVAAGFTVLHWWLIDQFIDQILFWFVPLVLLQLPRLLKNVMRLNARPRKAANPTN
ncbi:MAG: ferric reductase-like transmembrane domain-containing protein [Rhizobiaceae bacterium]